MVTPILPARKVEPAVGDPLDTKFREQSLLHTSPRPGVLPVIREAVVSPCAFFLTGR